MSLFELVLFSYIYPGVELLDNVAVLYLVSWQISILSCSGYTTFHCHHQCTRVLFCFFHILVNICCVLYDGSHADRCEVIFHCGFDLHFPDDLGIYEHLSCTVGHLLFLFGTISNQFFCHFFIQTFFFFVKLYELFIYVRY